MASVSFDIFEYIHDSRQAHGLRAQDYTRYRRFCAHHLRTVRKATNLTQGATGGFCKRNVTSDNANTAQHIEVQLLQAERAWAYAMDLRELHSRTEEPRQRQHMVQRLKAAVKAAHALAVIAPGFCDVRTALAAAAYWLQMQSQLRFELQQWEAALDSAALARVIADRLAQAGGAQYALAHAMLEALDPIVRLAAYRMRVPGAQNAVPAAIATEWYKTNMKDTADRELTAIPEYAKIIAALESLDASAGESVAFANQLHWRGGSVSFANQELAALVDSAQGQLQAGPSDTAVATFRKISKVARQCHAESAAAAQKTRSVASDALLSAYAAVQLYSACALGAIGVAQLLSKAQDIARACGVLPDTADVVLGRFAGKWAVDKAMAGQPGLSQLVAYYDQIRQRLAALQHRVASVEAKLLPAVRREISAQQIAKEVATAEAYYTCVRNYYSALLHASPASARFLDSLALLDIVVGENVPCVSQLATELAKRSQSQSGAPGVDALWLQSLAVSSEQIAQISSAAEMAMPAVRGLCASASASSSAEAWVRSPSRPPKMVANTIAPAKPTPDEPVPSHMPHLVDFTAEFAAVPAKPLFYDLAAPAIDFDMAAINARADKQGSSKLGSIIGSLWGSR